MPYRKGIVSFHLKPFSVSKMFLICNQAAQEWPSTHKVRLQNIVPHCLGDHVKCGEKWCHGKSDAGYKHKSLPYGKYLHGEELKKGLTQVSD